MNYMTATERKRYIIAVLAHNIKSAEEKDKMLEKSINDICSKVSPQIAIIKYSSIESIEVAQDYFRINKYLFFVRDNKLI